MFEHRRLPLITTRAFAWRQLKFLAVALVIVSVSLGVGVWGYMRLAGLAFPDAFLNASMILGGMGPVGDLPTDAAKYFASFYALYSGIALLTTVAVLLAPLVHRLLHALHVEEEEGGTDQTT
ncbi:MAG: hypothetical protein JNM31_12430 [Flavobacteriales bacterium]|nr:hypothetical protein [Flavobacteriales bacterium]